MDGRVRRETVSIVLRERLNISRLALAHLPDGGRVGAGGWPAPWHGQPPLALFPMSMVVITADAQARRRRGRAGDHATGRASQGLRTSSLESTTSPGKAVIAAEFEVA
jgi:hypothetical protein